jgi:hypothetical protein
VFELRDIATSISEVEGFSAHAAQKGTRPDDALRIENLAPADG